VSTEEGFLSHADGKIFYRAVGVEHTDATPLLCLHGGPGFTHYYLEALESLGDRRRVIFYDQLGCGRSDRPGDVGLWTVDRFVEELAQVRAAFGLDRLHLFGSSWGGMLAMQYVLDRQPDLVSLTLCGSPASMIRWVADCEQLLAEEPADVRQAIREHEAAGFTACPEYQAAILGFYRKHVCRMNPWPAGFERSFAEAGYDVYNTMNGPSEFTVTGTLKTWDIMDRLPEIEVPSLLIGGRYDECTPGHMADMHSRIRGSQLHTIEDASHLCFAEKPAEFNQVINSFFDRTDSATTAA